MRRQLSETDNNELAHSLLTQSPDHEAPQGRSFYPPSLAIKGAFLCRRD